MNALKEIRTLSNKIIAKNHERFFKTEKGQYSYGDIFLGVRTPDIRKIAKKYIELDYPSIKKLIKSKFHEERALGLIILCLKYDKFSDEQDKIYQIYTKHFKFINNWDSW